MFSKLTLFVVSAFALGAIAAPGGTPPPPPPPPPPAGSSQCNAGAINCCNSVQDASSSNVQNLAGLLGIAAGALTGQVGLNCIPISVIGASGNSCSSQPVCCTGNNFSGLVVVGCSPVNVNV